MKLFVNHFYTLLFVCGFLFLVSGSILFFTADKAEASPGSCRSGATCTFYIEFDGCVRESCYQYCESPGLYCCHKQYGSCISGYGRGFLAYCDNTCS